MVINEQNKEEYVRRAVRKVVKNFSHQWMRGEGSRRLCNVEKAINDCSKAKMDQIKQCIYEASYLHENLWYAYEEIKDFHDIRELLDYLSEKSHYDPATTLLQLVRCSRDMRVMNDKSCNSYKIAW